MALKSQQCTNIKKAELRSKECVEHVYNHLLNILAYQSTDRLPAKISINPLSAWLLIKILCLDREFYSTDVFDFLQKHTVSHIVPVVKKGNKIKAMLIGNKNRREIYTMKKADKKVDLDIVIDVKYMKGKRGKNGCENLGFVVFGVNWTSRKISTTHRRRFAIESSYRMRNQVKPKTSSKNATIHYFYAIISFLLKNVWACLQKKHFTIVKTGPPTIDEGLFRFDMFILLVSEWVRRKLGVKLSIECLG